MRFACSIFATAILAGCSHDRGLPDAGPPDAGPLPDGSIVHPCTLPGTVQFTANGRTIVPGGQGADALAFLTLPAGFCAHVFGSVGNARQLRFAPGGELFVASPTMITTSGGLNGQAAILVLPDDDHDGIADASITFLANLPSTQGLMFANDRFYWQDGTRIMRASYVPGQRAPSATSEQVADITYYTNALHWPKTMDIADDGSIYVGNGAFQNDACVEPHPFQGGIRKLDGTPNGKPIAHGLRNPIAIRCARGHDRCFALELAKDYTAGEGGREKMILIHEGDDWGFPCCATNGLPYPLTMNQNGDTPTCSTVTTETNAFVIGDTPFGLDFEPDRWPNPWTGTALVATHGAAGTWVGAKIVAIGMDPSTGLALPSDNLSGSNNGMADFATGWDDGTMQHGRPAALAFSPDGRLFVANDTTGLIFWIGAM